MRLVHTIFLRALPEYPTEHLPNAGHNFDRMLLCNSLCRIASSGNFSKFRPGVCPCKFPGKLDGDGLRPQNSARGFVMRRLAANAALWRTIGKARAPIACDFWFESRIVGMGRWQNARDACASSAARSMSAERCRGL